MSQLFYKQFPLSVLKYAEVFISQKGDIIIRLITSSSKKNDGRKSITISSKDLETVNSFKINILNFFKTPSKDLEFETSLHANEKGDTKLSLSIFQDMPYLSIRYFFFKNNSLH